MDEERTLDEALDAMDQWGNRVADAIQSLSQDKVLEYFRQSQSRLEQQTGKRLKLPVRSAPQTTVAGA